MRRILALSLTLLVPVTTAAQTTDDDLARAHFESGNAYDGIPTCERRCYDESECEAGNFCSPLVGATGILTYEGTALGVCTGDPCAGSCDPTERCVGDGAEARCVTNRCSTDVDCFPTGRCLWETCLAPCADSTECGAGSTCLPPPEAVCLAGCPNPAAGLCADGMTRCEDRNGDGLLDCIP